MYHHIWAHVLLFIASEEVKFTSLQACTYLSLIRKTNSSMTLMLLLYCIHTWVVQYQRELCVFTQQVVACADFFIVYKQTSYENDTVTIAQEKEDKVVMSAILDCFSQQWINYRNALVMIEYVWQIDPINTYFLINVWEI